MIQASMELNGYRWTLPNARSSIVFNCFNRRMIKWLLMPTAAWLFWILVNFDQPWPISFLSWSYQVSLFHSFFSDASEKEEDEEKEVEVKYEEEEEEVDKKEKEKT